jgi:predicted nucleotidyltransferase component of viral defense system
MSNTLFDQMLSRYVIQTEDDRSNALHEIMQQISLAGLYRAGFFNKAAFYGGTCLRIFHKLPRFSEDLDFSLLQPENSFLLENYFEAIIDEFKALGREVVISKKEKKQQTQVESAFLKDTTEIYNLRFQTTQSIKIKIEVDTQPPLGFSTEPKVLLLPFSFMVRCYTLPDLFAGKMHALLFRNWKNRVKGRDWYDFEWYVRNAIPLGFNHFLQRAGQTHGYTEETLTPQIFRELLVKKILETDMNLIKNDVRPFIKNQSDMDIWTTEYFLQLADLIK